MAELSAYSLAISNDALPVCHIIWILFLTMSSSFSPIASLIFMAPWLPPMTRMVVLSLFRSKYSIPSSFVTFSLLMFFSDRAARNENFVFWEKLFHSFISHTNPANRFPQYFIGDSGIRVLFKY